jgi:hypothetical protein
MRDIAVIGQLHEAVPFQGIVAPTRSPIKVQVQVIVQTRIGVSRDPSSTQKTHPPMSKHNDCSKEIRSLVGLTRRPEWYLVFLGWNITPDQLATAV